MLVTSALLSAGFGAAVLASCCVSACGPHAIESPGLLATQAARPFGFECDPFVQLVPCEHFASSQYLQVLVNLAAASARSVLYSSLGMVTRLMPAQSGELLHLACCCLFGLRLRPLSGRIGDLDRSRPRSCLRPPLCPVCGVLLCLAAGDFEPRFVVLASHLSVAAERCCERLFIVRRFSRACSA